jgi:tRNA A-37 threonylcarbamoyl transferase component Bud32
MDREQLRDLQQRSQVHALSTEVPLPGLRVLGTLGISGRGTLYAVRWEPRSTREPALLALRIVEDASGRLRRRLDALAAQMGAPAAASMALTARTALTSLTAPAAPSWLTAPAAPSSIDGLAMPIDHGTTASGRTYYTTELFERDLGRLPDALRPALPVLLADVARVLAAMHARGMVHGNLRASNVLIKEHAASYSIALCDPSILTSLTGSEMRDPAVDLEGWAHLAARAYGRRVALDGSLVPAPAEGERAMPDALVEIVDSVLAGGGPAPAQAWTAAALASALDALAADSGAVPRMRLAVGSGPTRSESAHARRALARAGFEVLACLGQGAAATVFRVHRGGRELAAKVLHGQRAMERLACVEGALDRLRDAGDAPLAIPEELGTLPTGAAFYTMEVFAGTLRARAAELDTVEALEILGEVARALGRLHRLGIVHRDLKPSNVLLTRSGQRHRVALADFELAQRPDEGSAAGELAGTPAQRPPEAITRRPATPAWDIWSWAATALWALHHAQPGAAGEHLAGEAPGAVADAVPGVVIDAVSGEMSGAAPDAFGDAFGAVVPEAVIDHAWLRARAAELASARSEQRADALAELLIACLDEDPARRPSADVVAACVAREVARLRAPAAAPGLIAAEPIELFAGLRALTAADRDLLAGRAGDVARMTQLLAVHRVVVLLGPAGAGKTSLLEAGLLPGPAALAGAGGPRYRAIVLRPGPRPFEALAEALLALPAAGGQRVRPSAAHVAHLAAALRKRGVAALWPHLGGGRAISSERPLLIVDQGEELFTAVSDAGERLAFAALLGEALAVRVDAAAPALVIAVRDELYGQLLSLPLFRGAVAHGYHFVQPVERAALQAMLEQTAARHGYAWEDGLAATVAAQAADSGHALSVLQVTASELWRRRERETRLIPRAALAAAGGVGAGGNAIDGRIAHLIDRLAEDAQLWHGLGVAPAARRAQLDDLVRALILRFVDGDGRCARPLEASALWQPFPAGTAPRTLAERVVLRLVQGGLLVCRRPVAGAVESLAPTESVALVHQDLLAISPRVQRWLAEEQPRRLVLDELRAAAVQWEAAGRAHAALWSGRALRRMRARLARHRVSLRGAEAAFWQACEARERARRGHVLLAVIAVVLLVAALALLVG